MNANAGAAAPTALRPALHVACLCAAWCRTCDDYLPVFEQAMAPHPQIHTHWIDIEDEADLVGDVDVETFPMLVIADDRQVHFAGPLTPQPETLQRVLRAALEAAAGGHAAAAQAPEINDFAQRLRTSSVRNAATAARGDPS